MSKWRARRALFAALAAGGTATIGLVGVAAAPAVSASLAGPQPLMRMVSNEAFEAPPTTATCEKDFGLACYQPSQYQAAYGLAPLYQDGDEGQGETIALVDSFGSPDIASQLATFDKAFGLPAPPSLAVVQPAGPVPPFDPTNATMVGWSQETSLDVEYAHTIAPKANLLLVETPVAETEGVVGFPQIVEAENYVIDNHLADVISQSFGATEETFPSASSLMSLRSAFVNAEVQHVTVLASSGDGGATDERTKTGYYKRPVDSWPSTDPLVTSVGGTQMFLTASGAHVQPDAVWNDTGLFGSPAASGGGTSEYFNRPTFQDGVKSVVGPARGTPDISMSAAVNGAALVYLGADESGDDTPGFYLIGGTSEASPLFSGIVALADQVAGHSLGDLNPTLYSMEASATPAAAPGDPDSAGIVDVTTGTNTVTFAQGGKTYTVPGHDAVKGYDLASGLGTVDGALFVPALARQGS